MKYKTLVLSLGLVVVIGLGGCVACSLWLFTPPPPLERETRPDWSPDGQAIVYECHLEGPSVGIFESDQRVYTDEAADICVVALDGGTRRRLTTDLGPDQYPVWSPDGSQIAYLRRDGLYLINPDGSHKRRLITLVPFLKQDSSITWLPDGRHLLFSALVESSTPDIFLVNTDTGSLTNLISDNNQAVFAPMLTADGTKVVFLSPLTGLYELPQLKVINVDGSNEQVILEDEIFYSYLSVSNNVQVAFITNALGQNYKDYLYSLGLEDEAPVRIGPAQIGDILSWSPDGRYLAVGGQQLTVLDFQEKTTREFEMPSAFYGSGTVSQKRMSWSPDSQEVAVTLEFSNNYPDEHIYIFNIQDGKAQPLLSDQ